jgi:uncharacterized protein (DUF1697 family)
MISTRYVAFLRALNVGGHNTVKMEVLRAHFESMRFTAVETFIASGNVIFESRSKDLPALAATIENSLGKALGYPVSTFLRTDAEVAAIAQYQPFPPDAVSSAAGFWVGFLSAPLTSESIRRAIALKPEMDDFHIHGTEFYWLIRLRQSESKFSASVLEKALGIRVTFRGMNTVQKLAAKFPPRQP